MVKMGFYDKTFLKENKKFHTDIHISTNRLRCDKKESYCEEYEMILLLFWWVESEEVAIFVQFYAI